MKPRRPGLFELALARMRVDGGEREANLRRAGRMIAATARGGAQVVVLPKPLDLGWTNRGGRRLGEPVPAGGRVKAENHGGRFISSTQAMMPE